MISSAPSVMFATSYFLVCVYSQGYGAQMEIFCFEISHTNRKPDFSKSLSL